MIVADMKAVNKIYNGKFPIKEVRYGDILVWKQGEGYTTKYNREVECLYAKGDSAYIITDLLFNDLTKYKFEIKGWCGMGATMLFGARDASTSGNINQLAMLHGANGNYQFRIMDGTSAASISAANTLPHVFVWDGSSYAMDGKKYAISSTYIAKARQLETHFGLALFGCNTGGIVDNHDKDRCIYYFKVWHEDELIVDYIPVIDNNGIACFYDTVSGKLIRCSSDGNFGFDEKEQL